MPPVLINNMVQYSGAKINLGLHILKKRVDGFHDLESIFFPIQLFDLVEVLPNVNAKQDIELSSSGIELDVPNNENILWKTYYFLKKKFPHIQKIKTHLHKNIPFGSGLGGGSSNAVAMYNMLKQKYKLNIPFQQEIEWLSSIGSDCPFFLYNKSCLVQGLGNIIKPIELDLSLYKIILFYPNIHISTKLIFANHIIQPHHKNISEIMLQPIEKWKDLLKNDLELTSFSLFPELQILKNFIYEQGAVYASMSGSGSCFYGIFHRNFELPKMDTKMRIGSLDIRVIPV